jgi:hypothetical protein
MIEATRNRARRGAHSVGAISTPKRSRTHRSILAVRRCSHLPRS